MLKCQALFKLMFLSILRFDIPIHEKTKFLFSCQCSIHSHKLIYLMPNIVQRFFPSLAFENSSN